MDIDNSKYQQQYGLRFTQTSGFGLHADDALTPLIPVPVNVTPDQKRQLFDEAVQLWENWLKDSKAPYLKVQFPDTNVQFYAWMPCRTLWITLYMAK